MTLLRLQTHLLSTLTSRPSRRGPEGERGQATAEYALVLLGAAAIAVFVVAWVLKTDLLGDLLDRVFGKLLTKADST